MSACAIAALVSITTACSTVDYQPTCTVPPAPSPPEVTAEDLEPLPADVYRRVIERDRILQDWALEQRAILREVCDFDEADGEGR